MLYDDLAAELVKYQFILLRNKDSNRGNIDLLRGKKRVMGYLIEVEDGVTPSKLCKFMDVSSARITSILNKLEEHGEIIRIPDKDDKRKKIVYLSEQGRKSGLAQQKKYIEDSSKMLRALGEYDAKEHVRIMKKIYNLLYLNMRKNNEHK